MVGFGSVGYGIQETPLEPEGSFPARQNTILRAYFRKRSSKIISSHNTPNWRHDLFVEKFVDQQIDYFLSQLQEKLSLLRFHFSRVEASLVTLLEAPSSQEQQLAHLQWENSLREVERYSGDAWNLLRYVFTGLEDRDYPQRDYLLCILNAINNINVESLLADNPSAQPNVVIKKHRLEVIANIKSSFDNND